MYLSRFERKLLSPKGDILAEKGILDRIKDLPTLPFIATRVMEIIGDPHSSALDLANVISTDQALTAKVLRLVNSAYYGFPNPITTITHAVAILGFNTLRSLVLSVATFDLFAKRGQDLIFDRQQLWLHSLAAAVCAKSIARRIAYPNQEEMFVAGLLHDVGKVILDQYLHSEFAQAIESAKTEKTPMYEAEKKVLGYNHAEIGKLICEKWRLPMILTEAIRYHHDVDAARDNAKIASIVHVADILVKMKGIGHSGDDYIHPVNETAKSVLRLEYLNINELLAEMQKGVHECKEFLQLGKEAQ
ncbi:MAG: HDOD domain-containing protein [Armatimonadetes bacterium]|nr:HDOD domain-containing protein [Armatimonadota bacterium]